jgi:hypothetical protein
MTNYCILEEEVDMKQSERKLKSRITRYYEDQITLLTKFGDLNKPKRIDFTKSVRIIIDQFLQDIGIKVDLLTSEEIEAKAIDELIELSRVREEEKKAKRR